MEKVINNKDKYGEVFTPRELIEELLNQLPLEVWTNSHLRWLDPCAGRGQFFLLVLERLMIGLSKEIPSPQKRRRHILGTMLYMVEINPENVRVLKEIFDDSENIWEGDFLGGGGFAAAAYDIILENPPYQVPKLSTYKGAQGNRTLWDKFIIRSLEILNPNGFLGAITPANWRRPENKLYKRMTHDNQLLYLHIYNKTHGKEYFHVQSRFDVYIISKTEPTYHPMIIDELGKSHKNIDPKKWPFLPNFAFPLVRSFLTTTIQPVIHDSMAYNSTHLQTKRSRKYKYPVIHTLTKKGKGIRYSRTNRKGHFHVPKVILNSNEKQYPVNDYRGEYAMSQLSFGIPIHSKKEGERIIEIIQSPAFQTVIRATKWGSFQTDFRMFRYMQLMKSPER